MRLMRSSLDLALLRTTTISDRLDAVREVEEHYHYRSPEDDENLQAWKEEQVNATLQEVGHVQGSDAVRLVEALGQRKNGDWLEQR